MILLIGRHCNNSTFEEPKTATPMYTVGWALGDESLYGIRHWTRGLASTVAVAAFAVGYTEIIWTCFRYRDEYSSGAYICGQSRCVCFGWFEGIACWPTQPSVVDQQKEQPLYYEGTCLDTLSDHKKGVFVFFSFGYTFSPEVFFRPSFLEPVLWPRTHDFFYMR